MSLTGNDKTLRFFCWTEAVYLHYDVFRKNPPILLLDEATDALDNESRNLIEKSLTDLFIVKATLIIANRRKKAIRDAERIIVPAKKGPAGG